MLTGLALVDGLAPEEEKVLLRAAAGLGLGKAEAKEILHAMLKGERAPNVQPPDDPNERDELFRSLIDVVAADGQVEFSAKIEPGTAEVRDLNGRVGAIPFCYSSRHVAAVSRPASASSLLRTALRS